MALGCGHPVAVPCRRKGHSRRAVPRHLPHVQCEHVRGGLPFGNGHGDHVGGDPRPAPHILLPGKQVRAVGRPPSGRGPGLGDVAPGAGFRGDGPPPGPLADVPENRPPLPLPRFFKGWRRLCRGHPEIQHERVHRADQSDRRIAVGEYPKHLADRAGRPGYAFPHPSMVDRNACQEKPCLSQPPEVCCDQLPSLLALTALGGEFGG
jgi:hypothetical protein